MKLRNYLIIAGIIILAFLLLKSWVCNPGKDPDGYATYLDSLQKSRDEVGKLNDLLKIAEGEKLELNFKRRQDSTRVAQALAAGQVNGDRLKDAIQLNRELKAANKELERLNNCDTLAKYAEGLRRDFDSVSSRVADYQQTIDDIMEIDEQALNAANAKALEMTKQAALCQTVLRDQLPLYPPVNPSPVSIGLHGGYGLSEGGLSPVVSFGINYDIGKPVKSFIKSLFKRKKK